ncbi:unnamed protein product [Boreogadus saida]
MKQSQPVRWQTLHLFFQRIILPGAPKWGEGPEMGVLLLLLTRCKSTSGGHCFPQPPPRPALFSALPPHWSAMRLSDLSLTGDDQFLTPGSIQQQ